MVLLTTAGSGVAIFSVLFLSPPFLLLDGESLPTGVGLRGGGKLNGSGSYGFPTTLNKFSDTLFMKK